MGMRLKVVTISLKNKDIEFVQYDEVKSQGNIYLLLIPKIVYLEMSQSVVDSQVLKKSITVFQRMKKEGRNYYIRLGDKEQEKIINDNF